MQKLLVITLLTAGLLAGGCATVPKPLVGEYSTITPQVVTDQQNGIGAEVRWGGTILATSTNEDKTCIEVLGQQLDDDTRPVYSDNTQGRFLACKSGFQDPAIFSEGREITITGRVSAVDVREIGDYEYRYPIVDTDVLFLWPDRFLVANNAGYYGSGFSPYYYSPFLLGGFYHGFGFSHFGYGYGFGFGRGFYPFYSRFGFGFNRFGYSRFGFRGRGFRGRGFRGRSGFRGSRRGVSRRVGSRRGSGTRAIRSTSSRALRRR